jgi:hypothetical protein
MKGGAEFAPSADMLTDRQIDLRVEKRVYPLNIPLASSEGPFQPTIMTVAETTGKRSSCDRSHSDS